MKILLKYGKYKFAEHSAQLIEKPCYIGVNECFKPEKECTGCAECKKEAKSKKKVIAIIPFEKRIHPCYKDHVDGCYKGGFYELADKDRVDLSGCQDCG